MRVLVIYCHPVAESFAAAAHTVVLEALRQAGHEVTDVDLYAEAFDPVMSRQERLDYQNPERNERLVKHYDDQLAADRGAGADLSSLVVRNAGNAEGIFRPRLAARCGIRRDAWRQRQHRAAEAAAPHHGGHHLWGVVVDGTLRHGRPSSQADRPGRARPLRAQLPGHVVRALQHGQGGASAAGALSPARTRRHAGTGLSYRLLSGPLGIAGPLTGAAGTRALQAKLDDINALAEPSIVNRHRSAALCRSITSGSSSRRLPDLGNALPSGPNSGTGANWRR